MCARYVTLRATVTLCILSYAHTTLDHMHELLGIFPAQQGTWELQVSLQYQLYGFVLGRTSGRVLVAGTGGKIHAEGGTVLERKRTYDEGARSTTATSPG